MDIIKKKVLASILNGKNKVSESLNSYLLIEKNQKEKFDLDLQNDLKKFYEEFQINLYNYYRSIKDKKDYFEDYNLIREIMDNPIMIKSWRNTKSDYTFDDLFRVFRNKKEHYDKINCEEEYALFKTSITKEQLIELYNCCNKVLDKELSKLTEDEILNFITANPEIKVSFDIVLTNIIETNEKNKAKYPAIYELNNIMIEMFKKINLESITMDELDNIYYKLNELLKNGKYKYEFVKMYGLDLYNYLLSMYKDDNTTFEDDKQKFNHFLQEILKINNDLKNGEV